MSATATAFVLILSLATVGAGSDDGPGRVSGVVAGPDGRPAPGAELVAVGGDWDGKPPRPLARAVADGQGRFSMDLAEGSRDCERATLWAYRPGSVAASAPVDRAALAGLPIRLALGSSSGSRFRVAGPEGRPVAGARIIPRRLARDDLAIPSALAEWAGSTTDASGWAVLGAFRPEELASVVIEAAGFGTQVRDFRSPDGRPEAEIRGITLIAPGRVSGRVVADDPPAASGLKVLVSTSVGGGAGSEVGIAEVATDASGRFEVGAIAAGSASVSVVPRPNSPDLPGRAIRLDLEPGGTVAVEVRLRRGVRVTGLARDARDGRPVAGVLVAVVPSGPYEPSRVRTDPSGRYEAYVPAGLVTHRVLRVPGPYLGPPDFLGPRPVEVPPAIALFELPLIALTRGVELRGSVADKRVRPVSGAWVEASWTLFDGRARVPRSASTRSEADGSFVIGPVDPEAELSLTASAGPSATARPLATRASDGRPIALTLVVPDAASPSGRVVDSEGRPVAGASVWIREASGSSIAFDGADHLEADPQGRFQGPPGLRRDREYLALAGAEGFREGRTRPLRPGPSGALSFPEIVLRRGPRRFAVEGRVLDRQGRPVGGAEVRAAREGPCLGRTVSGVDGRFRLGDLPGGRDFLFAEAEGFRFAGRAIDPAAGAVDLTLTRLTEAPEASMKTRAIDQAPPALARGVLAGYVERVLSQGDQATRVRALERLARVDPRRVLALVDAQGPEDAWLTDHLRLAAVSGLIGSDLADDALAAIASIRDGRWRARADLEAADALPASSRARKREWVERALVDARTVRDPSGRVVALAGVARRLIDLGEPDRASRLLDDSRQLVESLPLVHSGGRARGAFAEALAGVDPSGALALTEGLVDPAAFDRARLTIARVLAGRDPARAARVLATLRDPRSIGEALPGLCHALARVDPDRARRLIEQARPEDPCLPAYALGMMALAVADLDRPGATAWLRGAFDLLADRAESGPVPSGAARSPAAVAASLLPVAERVDPGLVPELFWRAVSLHGPGSAAPSEAIFAMLLGRYDRSVGLAFFEPLADRTSAVDEFEPLVIAAATLDPALADRLVEGLPDAPDLAFHHPKNGARLALAAALARPAPACWDQAVARYLHLWTPGSPDAD